MAELREANGTRACLLQPEHLIGRGPQCALRLEAGYVSAQHALLRWSGRRWELIDRGSRNGTLLNGALVEARRDYPLVEGAVLAFGHPNERWTLTDASEPEPMLIVLDTGEPLLGSDGVIGVPSASDPAGTVYLAADGAWKLELPDREVFTLFDGHVFEAAGRSYRFCCPVALASTAARSDVVGAGTPTLRFSVSSCEEFVEAWLEYPDRVIALGARAHNYLLLVLARARLADASRGVAEAAAGWMYKEQLAEGLRTTPQQIDGEVFRIRRHLARCGVPEAGTFIERRSRTTQLRLANLDLRIAKG